MLRLPPAEEGRTPGALPEGEQVPCTILLEALTAIGIAEGKQVNIKEIIVDKSIDKRQQGEVFLIKLNF